MNAYALRFIHSRAGVAGDTRNIAVIIGLKQSSLLGGVALKFVQIELAGTGGAAGFVFTLNAAFRFVALFLLPRMFFLAFGETRPTSSWHTALHRQFRNSDTAMRFSQAHG